MRQCDGRDRLVVETRGIEEHGVAAILVGVKDVDEEIAVAFGGIRGTGDEQRLAKAVVSTESMHGGGI